MVFILIFLTNQEDKHAEKHSFVFIKCNGPQVYQSSRPLRIGYLENDGYQQPSPSFVRGLREVKALLEQAGHTVRQQHSKLDMHLMTLGSITYVHDVDAVTFGPAGGALHASRDYQHHD